MEYSKENIAKFKWPVSVSQKIEVPPERIWTAISTPGNLEDCHPFCEKNLVDKWPGVGAKDIIYYYSGWVFEREFVSWIEGKGYDLTVGRAGGEKSYVSWRITEEGAGTGKLRITIYPHRLQSIPLAVRWVPHLAIMRPQLRSYLKSVVKGFEWFITTGEPVRKNQFGAHKWFSNNDKL